jgi:hypothetical protein
LPPFPVLCVDQFSPLVPVVQIGDLLDHSVWIKGNIAPWSAKSLCGRAETGPALIDAQEHQNRQEGS